MVDRYQAAAQVGPRTYPREEVRFLVGLLAYFMAYVAIRVATQGSLERDEAEIVYLTQRLELGYGTQPPLYAWLQWLAFSVFGLNRFSLAVLKGLILAVTYFGMYRLARPFVGRHGAVAAAASLVLFPQIGWESLRDLTHSVLLTCAACCALWCYTAILRKQDIARYALFGLVAGLGMQTKYNFAIFLAGLACASLMVREHRSAVWTWKAWASVATALLVFLPHGIWLLQNLEQATSGTLDKLAEGAAAGAYLANVGSGLKSILLAATAFAAIPGLVFGIAWLRVRELARADFHSPQSRFFLYLYASFLGLLLCIVLTGEVGKIKDRWMLPLLFSLPLALLVMQPVLQRGPALSFILRVCGVVGLLVLTVLPLRTWYGPALGKIAPPHHPYPELSAELKRQFPETSTIIAEGTLVAGNLRFNRTELRTLLLESVVRDRPSLRGGILLVMPDDADPAWLERFLSAYPQARVGEQGRISLPYRFGGKGNMAFDYAHVQLGEQ